MWQTEKITRWLVVNPENNAHIVEYLGDASKPRGFRSERAAQIAADDMNEFKGDE